MSAIPTIIVIVLMGFAATYLVSEWAARRQRSNREGDDSTIG